MTKKSLSRDMMDIEKIITRAAFMQLAFSKDGQSYILPFSFGYRNGVFYFHSKKSGKKLDMLAANDRVAFALQDEVHLLEKNNPCGYSFEYTSITGWGKATIICEEEEKRFALEVLAGQYSSQQMTCSEETLDQVTVFKVVVEEIAMKKSSCEHEG